MRIAVIGAGSWGTALATVAARAGNDVVLWARSEKIAEAINTTRTNPVYLVDTELPRNLKATTGIDEALDGVATIVLAVPSHATRSLAAEVARSYRSETVLVGAMKGIEIETGKRMSEVVSESLNLPVVPYVGLSGPSFAREVVNGNPTAVVAAGEARECKIIQNLFSFENLRVYTNADLIGVELSGAVKNVMAIAAGMVAGMGLGANSVAALITRGLAEMSRLVLSQGGRRETLMGLAGVGDLVLTCTGALSRNRHVGYELARGRQLSDICNEMKEVAEGINTTRAVRSLARSENVEMPITDEVYSVLYESKTPQSAVAALMNRPLKEEF